MQGVFCVQQEFSICRKRLSVSFACSLQSSILHMHRVFFRLLLFYRLYTVAQFIFLSKLGAVVSLPKNTARHENCKKWSCTCSLKDWPHSATLQAEEYRWLAFLFEKFRVILQKFSKQA